MQKTRRKRWQTLALIGLALILGTGLVWQGVGFVLGWLSPDNQAYGDAGKVGAVCTAKQSGPVFGKSLVVNEGEVVCGDFTLFGSTLDVKGQVRGNILAFGSNIHIAGTVSGNINLYGGEATLQAHSHVLGNINLFGGSQRLEAGARLDGETNNRSQHVSLWLPGISPGFAFPIWQLVVWVVLGLALVSLLPEHVMFVRTTVTSKTRRSLALGLLSLVLVPIVLVVLIALIILIPLAIVIAIGLIAAWALGTIAIGWLVGEYIMRVIAPRHNTRLAQVSVGLTVLILVGSIPYIGWIVSTGAGILGLGAVFLSRFGTRLYSQPRHPLRF
ncbi:MAG TPA: polymer-forming cytoskeletal protein [Ktedonobacteraceae bacterium]